MYYTMHIFQHWFLVQQIIEVSWFQRLYEFCIVYYYFKLLSFLNQISSPNKLCLFRKRGIILRYIPYNRNNILLSLNIYKVLYWSGAFRCGATCTQTSSSEKECELPDPESSWLKPSNSHSVLDSLLASSSSVMKLWQGSRQKDKFEHTGK